jgi:microcystin degradation protein MlrC
LSDSVARAKEYDEGPVLLIDHGDNAASGGTQDTTFVLREVIKQGLEDVALFSITDQAAVGWMIEAGVGSRITLLLGGKTDMPAIGLTGEPVEVTGTVRTIADGEFIVRGPVYTGMRAKMGRSVCLDTGPVQIVVTERQFEPWDLGAFRSVGIEPTQKKYLVLKSRIHYRGAFLPIARHVIECDSPGATSSNFDLFPFKKLRRPIYPLDPDAQP